jgi:hypothetical protein
MRAGLQWLFRRPLLTAGGLAVALCALFVAAAAIWGCSPPALALVNSLFVIGLCQLVLGMMFYIRNIGLFKIFGYWGYRATARRQIRRSDNPQAQPMDLAAYTAFLMARPPRPAGAWLGAGGLAMAISTALAFLWY